MSRTTRYIPHWARTVRPHEKTWWSLGWYTDAHLTGSNPRNRFERGYDKHNATSVVYSVYPRGGYTDRDSYTGNTRKHCKRLYHRGRRLFDKKLIAEGLNE